MKLAAAPLAVFGALAAIAPAQEPPPIEQLMSSPFPSGLTAAPSGGHIAWVRNSAGVRNIWVASPDGYEARAITAYKSDDGQEISDLQWAPGAASIVYVRGGSPNRAGEVPNPRSEAAGADQAVWAVPLGGGEPKKLGEGASPAVSAKGLVAFLQKGQVWTVPADGSSAAVQLMKSRGRARTLRWSPDGGKLAFVSSRGAHSFIGIFEVAASAVRYVAPGLSADTEPAWSPDGRELAFLRMPASSDQTLFGPRRSGDPWSIWIADASTGKARQVFQADPGRGSVFHGLNAEAQILWAASGHLVFPWERDGWLHLYSIPVAGDASPKLLTFGDYEAENALLTADAREVLYTSNADDIDRRHLYRVAAAGGPVNPVTSGNGIEWSPVMTSDGKAVAFLRSEGRTPARASIMAAFGAPRDLVPFEFPAASLVEPQPVTFAAADGLRIRAQLFAAANPNNEKRPAVIFFHGGSRRQMLLGWHYLPYYHNAYAFNQYLASRGYVVLSVNYRSGIGYGMEFREALNYGATGASEFNDVLGAGLFLQGRADVDSRRIGLWGGSYGGYLTALGLSRAADLFAAGVDIHGVHDWNSVIRNFNPGYDPEKQADFAKKAFASSPMASVGTWKAPVLLIHGDDDRNVPFNESIVLAEALRKQGVSYEELVFPDEVHGFLLHSHWLAAFRAAGDFLDRRVKARK
ncbi:MAG: prolyl oligopeptidase family serine peptidase [Bryobacteraceae bacterium]